MSSVELNQHRLCVTVTCVVLTCHANLHKRGLAQSPSCDCGQRQTMVWYGMVNVDLYSAIIMKVSNVLNTTVSGEKPGFQALSKGLIVLLCAEVVRQGVPDHGMLGVQQWIADVGGPPSVAVWLT